MNDVQIQVERGEDVFLGTHGQILVPEKQLRVHGQEAGEDQRSHRCIDEVQDPVVQKDAHDPEEQHDDEANEQHAVTGSEVIFGLQREDDDREADQHCNADSHHHDISVVEAGDHTHHVGHRQRQDTQTNEVPRMLPANLSAAQDH